jgi:hypothetical protein
MAIITKTDLKPVRVKRLANETYDDIDAGKIPPIQQQA